MYLERDVIFLCVCNMMCVTIWKTVMMMSMKSLWAFLHAY